MGKLRTSVILMYKTSNKLKVETDNFSYLKIVWHRNCLLIDMSLNSGRCDE